MAMKELNNIFVVYDPTKEEQPALLRAANIAREAPATLHVYACIHEELPGEADKQRAVKSHIEGQKTLLSNAIAPLVSEGIEVTTEVEWDKDWYHAVVRASIRNHADVVLKSSYRHSQGQRILNKSSDWTLIRECVCPVLLVKEGETRDVHRVLAAVDIRADKENYEKLNKNIITFSKRVLDRDNAEVHFVNAHKDLSDFPDRNALLRNTGVGSDRIHIKMGDPDDVIVENAKDLDVSLVVIGNSARSGLSAVVRGNTVEKVLDKLECDVLSIP
jgi:universal stress protein E